MSALEKVSEYVILSSETISNTKQGEINKFLASLFDTKNGNGGIATCVLSTGRTFEADFRPATLLERYAK